MSPKTPRQGNGQKNNQQKWKERFLAPIPLHVEDAPAHIDTQDDVDHLPEGHKPKDHEEASQK